MHLYRTSEIMFEKSRSCGPVKLTCEINHHIHFLLLLGTSVLQEPVRQSLPQASSSGGSLLPGLNSQLLFSDALNWNLVPEPVDFLFTSVSPAPNLSPALSSARNKSWWTREWIAFHFCLFSYTVSALKAGQPSLLFCTEPLARISIWPVNAAKGMNGHMTYQCLRCVFPYPDYFLFSPQYFLKAFEEFTQICIAICTEKLY